MPRHSIPLTEPNDECLSAQAANTEYISKSDVVNDLIRHARQQQRQDIEAIQTKLIRAEQGGFSDRTPEQIRHEAKQRLNLNGLTFLNLEGLNGGA